jgi:hypothetical protein
MSKNLHHANNATGVFMLAVVLFVIAFAVNRAYPTPATPWILTLLGLLAFGALGAGLYFRVKNLNWDK